jgi:hypothetical protein
MTAKMQEKRAAKKKAEKAAEKKEIKKEQQEKIKEKLTEKADKSPGEEDEEDYVILQADSVEELLKKIDDYNFSMRADSVQTPYEKSIGQSIDFRG